MMMVLRMMVKHQLTDILTYRWTDVLKIITQTTTTRTRLTAMNLHTTTAEAAAGKIVESALRA